MKISCRDIHKKAWLDGGPFVTKNPYPTSPMIPSIGDPYTYELIKIKCPNCNCEEGKKYAASDEVFCSECKSRISLDFIDKSFSSPLALKPSTLNAYPGSNTNNEAGGVQYHKEPYNPPSTWTGGLGK